ncbi:LytTR family DNA-binding domain-containing protein [Alteromonas sp. ASW11-36]|uniref:LytTR family DNA-binding domain-containing protein n=1 Tax=Alteromonas arenosi TaxID=3055817 RepID=A0ABT7T0Y5_9ALTE|nr:LytTR family DNA-binding domain-containing protein [Alteromonas sp. ASW11-36]MDM7861467.1 LytTR family DNA-binding domain-containing protein [Alteromonas sp. ASW11-36]
MIKVLIVDDEPLARECIAYLLNDTAEAVQCLQAENGDHALQLLAKENVDVAFLDMQMPGISGLQLAKQLPETVLKVFVTAYDEFALPAFEVNAVDYLLKPYSDARFAQAWQKVLAKLQPLQPVQNGPKPPISERAGCKSRLVVRDPGRIRLIDVKHVNYITGAGNYVELHLDDGKTVLHRETMTALEQQLDPDVFIRIHRSSIVRRSFVIELRPNDKGDYTVILESGDLLTLSRRNRDKIEALTG